MALAALFLLPLIWFAPVLFSGHTLLPFDNLYTFEPWRSLQPGLIPHNNLLSDLVLENAVWKLHIRRVLAAGQLPFWNPQIFTGVPFLAAGQASTLYPLNLLFYLFPLESAYGWFTALQLAIAGINLYILGRVLRLPPLAALFGGVVFQFSGFLIVSVVFPMVIAAAAWLPLLLAIIEFIVRKQEEKGGQSFRPVPYVVAGAAVIGVMTLAGHPEFFYYTLLVAGIYAAVRLGIAWRRIAGRQETVQSAVASGEGQARRRHEPQRLASSSLRILKLGGWLLVLAILGVAAGAVQLLPLFELVSLNFREGSASYQQVVNWAWPSRHVLTFWLPNVFGNPSHHRWFDLWQGQWQMAGQNALGEPVHTIFWGVKNYVEGGNYLGLLTWLLAGVAVTMAGGSWRLAAGKEQGADDPLSRTTHQALRAATWIFAGLAALSLLFAFGTPLYALLFYGLPGWNQLHSPFRWVFPFTISMALLGAIGLAQLLRLATAARARLSQQRSLVIGLAWIAIVAGLGALALVALSYFVPGPFVQLSQRIVDGSDLAQMAFANGRMFWGYQSVNLIKFGLFAALSGGLVWWAARGGTGRRDANMGAQRAGHLSGQGGRRLRHVFTSRRTQLVGALAICLVFADLYAAHGTFNPATDPGLSPLRNVPPVVQFLNEREGAGEIVGPSAQPWRFTTFDLPGEKTFNANVGMYYGWQDVRGYDSIIPRQYVRLMERIAPQQNELLYNRIAPLYADSTPYDVLDNPLLDLLNVKYVLTQHVIPNPSWKAVYQDGAVRVYENSQVLPRVFIASQAQVLPVDQQPLLETDLRHTVFLDDPIVARADTGTALVPASPQIADARVSRYTANDVFVDVNLSDRGWLVLTDAYFPGWKAYLRPFGGDESQERQLSLYRADGAFRSVYLPEAGQWTVRFVYSPMSIKLGLYATFLAAMTGLLLLLWWAWGRYYRPESTDDEVRTVAKNSLVPMGLNLANKAIDFAFAMLYVRLLGPEGTGKYAFVVAVYGFFEIVSRYGLGTLLTRDVAADKNQSSRYLTNVLGLRTLLWAGSMPVLAAVTALYWVTGSIGLEEIQAIALFAVAMLFANWADGLSSVFNAFEKMEYPAGLSSATALLKVTFGALVLLLGWGFVGLAGVSLVMNAVQVIWLYSLVRSTLFVPEWHWDWPLQKWMVATSGPLMINHLLATIFWRIDLWILRPLAGAFSVGLYSAALKYLDGLNIIPSTFTFAIFPLMSRYAKREGEGLLRSYLISVRLLLFISLPVAMTITVLAGPLIYVLGGAEFLNVPDTVRVLGQEISYRGGSALALQVIIWSIPIGFVNSVTQFVLIAVNQQRYLTKAFVVGVVFNVVGNLLLIPAFDYIGAAVVTILSEFSLLIPFYWCVKGNVGTVPWLSLAWRPLVATVVMGAAIAGLTSIGMDVWLAVGPGWIVYVLVFALVGGFRGEDMAIVGRALPIGPLRRLFPAADRAHGLS